MKLLLNLIFISFSLFSFAQEKNILLNVCNIGDTIYKLPYAIYCEFNNAVSQNLTNCESRKFRYFPSNGDSSAFTMIKFQSVLIIGDMQNLVTNIWLLNAYFADSSTNNKTLSAMDYSVVKDYLDKQLNVTAEESRSYMAGGGTIKGFIWRTNSLTYHLKLFYTKNKKKEKIYTLSVQIH